MGRWVAVETTLRKYEKEFQCWVGQRQNDATGMSVSGRVSHASKLFLIAVTYHVTKYTHLTIRITISLLAFNQIFRSSYNSLKCVRVSRKEQHLVNLVYHFKKVSVWLSANNIILIIPDMVHTHSTRTSWQMDNTPVYRTVCCPKPRPKYATPTLSFFF